MREPWDANIETAKESSTENLSEPGNDGNREYNESGTYGQSDFTVRDRGDGTSDVYVTSDSEKGHSHDLIKTSTGELITSYHNYLAYLLEVAQSINDIESVSEVKKYTL